MIGGTPVHHPGRGPEADDEALKETGCGTHTPRGRRGLYAIFPHHYNMDIIDRMDKFGMLTDNSLLVHGLWLNDHEVDLINQRGCFFAHNARSNMNNHVGYCKHLRDVKNLIIGTDGCGGNMFEELKIAFFNHKDEGGPWWPSRLPPALTRATSAGEVLPRQGWGGSSRDTRPNWIFWITTARRRGLRKTPPRTSCGA
jgi:hypothetical protein